MIRCDSREGKVTGVAAVPWEGQEGQVMMIAAEGETLRQNGYKCTLTLQHMTAHLHHNTSQLCASNSGGHTHLHVNTGHKHTKVSAQFTQNRDGSICPLCPDTMTDSHTRIQKLHAYVHTHTHTLSLTLKQSLTCTLICSLTQSLTCTLTQSLTRTLTQSHTRTHTQSPH